MIEGMDLEKYNVDKYIKRISAPIKPTIKNISPTIKEIERYKSELKIFEERKKAFEEYCKKYREKFSELAEQFFNDLVEMYIPDHLKSFKNTINKMYSISYEHGHSAGYSEIRNYFSELATIFDAIEKDLEENSKYS